MHPYIEVSGPFPLVLEPRRPLRDLVAAARFDAVAPRFWEVRFRIAPEAGPVQDWIVRVGRRIPQAELLDVLREARFEPDRLLALLDFGRRYPDVQRLAPVVALGEAADDGAVPILSGTPSGRSLSLSWRAREPLIEARRDVWATECLFLCRRAAA
jgi:hypothetical protein